MKMWKNDIDKKIILWSKNLRSDISYFNKKRWNKFEITASHFVNYLHIIYYLEKFRFKIDQKIKRKILLCLNRKECYA